MDKKLVDQRQENVKRYIAEQEANNERSRKTAKGNEKDVTEELTHEVAEKLENDHRRGNLGRNMSGSTTYGPPLGGWPGLLTNK